MMQGDLFGGESLAVRRARRDPRRGSLEWQVVSSHSAPSIISEIIYWGAYFHRARICGQNTTEEMSALNDDLRHVLNTCNLVQCDLIQARRYEISLGLRFSRAEVLSAHLDQSFSRELKRAYSYGLVYLYLERTQIVSQWGDPPDPLAPLSIRP